MREVHLDRMAAVRPHVRVPFIANGGISSMADVPRVLAATSADAVMSSEALLENPALFCANICPRTGEYVSLVRRAWAARRGWAWWGWGWGSG